MEAARTADSASGDVRQPAATAAREAAANAPAGFEKRRNRGSIRKRAADDEDDGRAEGSGGGPGAGEEGGGIVRKTAKQHGAPGVFTTKRADRTQVFTFDSNSTLQQQRDGGATRENEQETAHDRDARALREQVLAQAGGAVPAAASGEDGVYRGLNNYRDYRAGFRREHTIAAEKGGGAHGPMRAATNIRMTVRFDYQADICKDYKETGYCGYGDACKFMHDRGDYKRGWELDRDWEAQQKAERERILAGWKPEDEEGGESKEGEEEEDEGLPFACFICRRVWAEVPDPVVTRCKHYFCEQCALQHNAKTPKCYVCEQPTGGIFNVAHDIERRERARQRKATDGSAGGGGSSAPGG